MEPIFGGCTDGNLDSHDLFGHQQWANGFTAALQDFDDVQPTQYNMAEFDQSGRMYEHDSDMEIVDVPSKKSRKGAKQSQRGAKQKVVSRRGGAFTKEEDIVICSAFLNVSRDPITGVNQTSGGYYKRMHEYFNKRKPEGSSRSQISVQHRWGAIQKAVNRFCALKSSIDRRNESGKSEQDRIDDAVFMFEKREPFVFMHCWKVLRNEAKWNNRFLETINKPPSSQVPPEADKGHTTIELDEPGNGSTARPEGRDAAKRRRAAGVANTSPSRKAVDVLQRLHEKSEITEKKQDQQMLEILNRKDEKIKIQRDLLKLQKKQARISMKQHKKEIEIREKQTEAQLISAEAGIMSIDIEKVPPYQKSYYLGMQRQILERRGFTTPSNDD